MHAGAPPRLNVGVVGCGSIAQIAHLPNLRLRPDLFRIAGVADLSPTVARWTASRFDTQAFIDHLELIEKGNVEALIVASPHVAHAQTIFDALQRGVHVLVEKPVCIASADAHTITRLAEEGSAVVQVGYMKRHDDAFANLYEDIQRDGAVLRSLHASTIEAAELHRTFQPVGMAPPSDLDAAQLQHWRQSEREQMLSAIETDDEGEIAVYRGLFLADLVHDLNLAHAVLAALGERRTQEHEARWWSRGRAGSLAFTTAAQVRCTIDYVEVPGRSQYEEELTVVTDLAVHRLRFPAPYLDRAPTLYEHRLQDRETIATRIFQSVREPFMTELERFHASIVGDAPCLTPAADAIDDLLALESAFVAGRRLRSSDR
jgi:predicted dehydrogenase